MNQREPIALDTRNPDHLALLLDVATDAARQAGALIKKGITDDLHVSFKDEGKHNLVTIMDTSGTIITRSENPAQFVGTRRYRPSANAQQSAGAVTRVRDFDGNFRVTGHVRAASAPWIAITGIHGAQPKAATSTRANP